MSSGIKKTQEQFLKEAYSIHENLYDFSSFIYINDSTKGEVICNRCGRHFMMSPNNILVKKQGCKVCNNKEAAKKRALTTEQFIEKARQIHGNKYDYSKVNYINNSTKIEIICPVHGSFWQEPRNHIGSNRQGCPKCGSSKGENQIRDLLDRYEIKYEIEKTFDDLIYKRNLRFDFYLSEYNLCIEYQGKQHYKLDESFLSKEEFKENQIRDNLKRKYCKNHNIDLLEIRYNEDIKDKIINYLNLPLLETIKLPEKERIYLPEEVKNKLKEWYVYNNSIRVSSYSKFQKEFPEIYNEYKNKYRKVGIARELAKDLGVIYYEKNDSAKCIVCEKDSLWNDDYNCMRATCSDKCGRELSYKNLKKSLSEKGVENSSQLNKTMRTKRINLLNKIKERISPDFTFIDNEELFYRQGSHWKEGTITHEYKYRVKCNKCGKEFKVFLGSRVYKNKLIYKPICNNCNYRNN